jgi:excisionase family DNA binding protein
MRLLTIIEASERMGLKPSTLRFWIWTRKIEHVKVGRAVRLKEATVQFLIEQGTVPARLAGHAHGRVHRELLKRPKT